MAQAAEEVVAPPPKSKKILVIGIVVLLLSMAGVASYVLMQPKPVVKNASQQGPKAEATAPVFVPLEIFTVNLQADFDERYLQVEMTLRVADDQDTEIIKLHMPELRNRILFLLSSKRSSDLSSVEGKQMLSNEIIKQVKLPFAESTNTQKCTSVFFTSFVIQ